MDEFISEQEYFERTQAMIVSAIRTIELPQARPDSERTASAVSDRR